MRSRYVVQMQMHQSDQITAREAAAILQCNVSTINRMAKDGRLPPVAKLPGLRGHNLFSRTFVEHLARQRERQEASA